MRQQAEMLVAWHGTEDALRGFRKHAIWYLTGMPVGREARSRLQSISSLDELDSALADIDPSVRLPVEALRMPRSHKGGPDPWRCPIAGSTSPSPTWP